jgi:hypothetical protein
MLLEQLSARADRTQPSMAKEGRGRLALAHPPAIDDTHDQNICTKGVSDKPCLAAGSSFDKCMR